jgi:uncharacterized phosphosugar-binding protein
MKSYLINEMEAFESYSQAISDKLIAAFGQKSKIQTASNWVADSLEAEGWIYTTGTGHSHLLAEDIFYRAGGFARVIPILDPALMLHENASKSTEVERIEGYAAKLLSEYRISSADVFLISSNSGRNPVSIEMAQLAKAAGAKVICITNIKHSKAVSSRHSSGLKLYEICDLYLDNFGEIGDAGIALKGLNTKVGATSTVIGAALLQAIMVQSAQNLLDRGIKPELFSSSNADEGEELNQVLTEKYRALVKSI